MASTHTSIALPLFRLFLSTVATRGRLIVLGLLAAIGPAIGIAINRGTSTSRERTEAWAVVASNYGMTLLAGVGSLMVAAAVLGGTGKACFCAGVSSSSGTLDDGLARLIAATNSCSLGSSGASN